VGVLREKPKTVSQFSAKSRHGIGVKPTGI
jgi:hypothetical protein